MTRGAGVALLALAIAVGAWRTPDPRACRLPTVPLGSPHDTAAWCAREFIIRNGYTQIPPSRDYDDIAIEAGMDQGRSLNEMLDLRQNTVALEPSTACVTPTGYLVTFIMPNQINQPYGRGVSMTRDFHGLTLMRPWINDAAAVPAPDCERPRLPAPTT